MTEESNSGLRSFTMNGLPLLTQGLEGRMLAQAPQMWIQSRIYAEGGENTLHHHPDEDHAFFVLAGQATFVDGNGDETIAGQNDGIMIPRGTDYCFRATSDENLVILRIGSGESIEAKGRQSTTGGEVRSAGKGIHDPGRFFGV